MIDRALEHLRALVAIDTTNPPRALDARHPIVTCVKRALADAGFSIDARDLRDGCVNVLGVRGDPQVLLNCHLDTVPAGAGWTGDPLELREDTERVIGLGVCDNKGAAAAILAAAEATEGDAAILFTTDEEAGDARCVRTFLEARGGEGSGSGPASDSPRMVVVAEPTGCQAVTRHRGVVSLEATFTGTGAHASIPSAADRSALHRAARWCHHALRVADADPAVRDARLNIGVIEGGTKANMVADRARVVVGLRPIPGVDPGSVLTPLVAPLEESEHASWRVRFRAPSLDEHAGAGPFLAQCGLERADPVDFWTEAALFHESGLPALVLGPGDIARAHGADEWLEVRQLERACSAYASIIGSGRDTPRQNGRSESCTETSC